MHDAIVIGARCAGAVTATLPARRGHRVLLFERGVTMQGVPARYRGKPSAGTRLFLSSLVTHCLYGMGLWLVVSVMS